MNLGVALLIILTLLLILGVGAILVYTAITVSHSQGITGGTTGSTGAHNLPPCNQNINISNLVQIPTNGANCFQHGVTGPLFYIGNISAGQYDYVVAPWGTQPLDVCIGFCTGFTGGTCFGPNYNGQSAQSNFNRCMSQLSSTTCSPPIPIAAKQTFLYYAFSPTCNVCDNCG